MGTFLSLQATWSGGALGSGVTTLAVGNSASWTATQVDSARSALNTFFSGVETWIPDDVTIQIPQAQMLKDEVTGNNVGELVGSTAIAGRIGDGTGTFANGVGLSIQWNTDQFVVGRRVRGRTFLVPLVSSIFDADGTLTSGVITGVQDAANGLLTNLSSVNGGLQVWSRPREATAEVAARSGQLNEVVSAVVSDKPSWLRTRRD